MPKKPDLVTKPDIAKMLDVKPQTVHQWRFLARSGYSPSRSNALPFPDSVGQTITGGLLWNREDIVSWATQTNRKIVDRDAGGGHRAVDTHPA